MSAEPRRTTARGATRPRVWQARERGLPRTVPASRTTRAVVCSLALHTGALLLLTHYVSVQFGRPVPDLFVFSEEETSRPAPVPPPRAESPDRTVARASGQEAPVPATPLLAPVAPRQAAPPPLPARADRARARVADAGAPQAQALDPLRGPNRVATEPAPRSRMSAAAPVAAPVPPAPAAPAPLAQPVGPLAPRAVVAASDPKPQAAPSVAPPVVMPELPLPASPVAEPPRLIASAPARMPVVPPSAAMAPRVASAPSGVDPAGSRIPDSPATLQLPEPTAPLLPSLAAPPVPSSAPLPSVAVTAPRAVAPSVSALDLPRPAAQAPSPATPYTPPATHVPRIAAAPVTPAAQVPGVSALQLPEPVSSAPPSTRGTGVPSPARVPQAASVPAPIVTAPSTTALELPQLASPGSRDAAVAEGRPAAVPGVPRGVPDSATPVPPARLDGEATARLLPSPVLQPAPSLARVPALEAGAGTGAGGPAPGRAPELIGPAVPSSAPRVPGTPGPGLPVAGVLGGREGTIGGGVPAPTVPTPSILMPVPGLHAGAMGSGQGVSGTAPSGSSSRAVEAGTQPGVAEGAAGAGQASRGVGAAADRELAGSGTGATAPGSSTIGRPDAVPGTSRPEGTSVQSRAFAGRGAESDTGDDEEARAYARASDLPSRGERGLPGVASQLLAPGDAAGRGSGRTPGSSGPGALDGPVGPSSGTVIADRSAPGHGGADAVGAGQAPSGQPDGTLSRTGIAITQPVNGHRVGRDGPPVVIVRGRVEDRGVSSVVITANDFRITAPVVAGMFESVVPAIEPIVRLRAEISYDSVSRRSSEVTVQVDSDGGPVAVILLKPGRTKEPPDLDVRATWRSRPERLDDTVVPVNVQALPGYSRVFFAQNMKPGVYAFSLGYRASDVPVDATLYVGGGGTKATEKKLRRLTLNGVGRTTLARLLLPFGVLWEEDRWFTGRSRSSTSVTKFRFPEGVSWTEHGDSR